MSRMLHRACLYFQWVSHSVGGSMQHERDMKRCAGMLAACEKAWRSGLLLAVADAVEICRLSRQPPPDWLAEAVAVTVTKRMTKFERRRRRQDMIHLVRWDAVTELRERRHELLNDPRHDPDKPDDRGMTWEKCYAAVSELLAGTEAAGADDTIKASYIYVQRETEAGHGDRFLLIDRRIDETSDPLTFTRKMKRHRA
jgi:hypothetical protein